MTISTPSHAQHVVLPEAHRPVAFAFDAHFPAIGTAHASFLDQLRRRYHDDPCARLPLTPPLSPLRFACGERE
jgi:hypothetical protein